MPYNTFTVGSDCQVVVMGPFGRVDLAHVTGFEAHQVTTSLRVDRLDGVQLGAELPKGWTGSFMLDRGSSAVDDFIAQIEQAYLSGQTINSGTLYQYVNEPDGSTSTYQFNGVVFKLTSAGVYRGDAAVTQKLDFYASGRTRV
jgi:predicted transcriptional regulator